MVRQPIVKFVTLIVFTGTGTSAIAADFIKKIPDEYEAVGGEGLAFGNAGSVATAGIGSVRMNPAMLPLEKQYRLSAGYHWPSLGREFFQLGVVDSKTSNVAAGAVYTAYSDKQEREDLETPANASVANLGSPVIRRGALGIAQVMGKVSVGIGAEYVEALTLPSSTEWIDNGEDRISGTGLNGGFAAALTPSVRVGASGENLTNRKIAPYAPKTYRAGVAYIFGDGNTTAHADWRRRSRVLHYEGRQPDRYDNGQLIRDTDDSAKKPEDMMIGSFSVRLQDQFRMVGSYGHALTDQRRTLSGGVAIVSNNYVLSYQAARPDLRIASAHQTINLSLEMSM